MKHTRTLSHHGSQVEGSICIFSLSTVADIVNMVGRITSERLSHCAALCCDSFVTPEGRDVLVVGDDSGCLRSFAFSSRGWHACDGELPSRCHDYPIFRGITITVTQCHDEGGWLTSVKYIGALGAVATASSNGELRLFDVNKKMRLISQFKHAHGTSCARLCPVGPSSHDTRVAQAFNTLIGVTPCTAWPSVAVTAQ